MVIEMAMTKNEHNIKNDSMIFMTLEELVPKNHLVRKLEAALDWRFIYPLVSDLYSSLGRKSIDPVILFKMVIINYVFGIHSMRKTCEEIKVNIAYRWFLGLSIEDTVPNYSTFSKNYERRYKDSDVFNEIFEHILNTAINAGLVDVESIFVDSTHIKANANKHKATNEKVMIEGKIYQDELDKEINNDRIAHGKKEVNVTDIVKTKNRKVSITDPESGLFHKGEKEKCFAYTATAACDKNGFILLTHLEPGNVHDSRSFVPFYNVLSKKYYADYIKCISCDAGYVHPYICKRIFEDEKFPILPYKRPMTKKGFFRKNDFVYDEYYDCYICPNNKILKYSTTSREGYKEYKSNPKDCEHCPFRNECTASRNHQKVVIRHVWAEYVESANELRYTPEHKEIYQKRKETIERVFAEAKENHGLRFTRHRGIKRVEHSVIMIFMSINLKKLSTWTWNRKKNSLINAIFTRLFYIYPKQKALTIRESLLSTL